MTRAMEGTMIRGIDARLAACEAVLAMEVAMLCEVYMVVNEEWMRLWCYATFGNAEHAIGK